VHIYTVFWLVLGLGIAIPFSAVAVFNIFLSMAKGDNYELDLKRLGIIYLIALVGWAITFGVR